MSNTVTEAIDNIHKEIVELRNEQNEFRINITKYVTSTARDTEWVREKIDDINNKFGNCEFCKNPSEVSEFKKSIKELKEDRDRAKWTIYGGTVILTIIISILLWFIQNKEHILQ